MQAASGKCLPPSLCPLPLLLSFMEWRETSQTLQRTAQQSVLSLAGFPGCSSRVYGGGHGLGGWRMDSTPGSALSAPRTGFIWSPDGVHNSQNSKKQKVQPDPSHLQMARPSKTTEIWNSCIFGFEVRHMISFHSRFCLPTNVRLMLLK